MNKGWFKTGKILLVLSLSFGLFLAGCSKKEDKSVGANGNSNGDATIKIAWFSPDPEIFVKPFIAAFEQKYPHIKVDAMISPNYNAYTEKMSTSIAGGESYDAVYINTEFGQWAGQGYLSDLSDFVKKSNLDMKKEYKDYFQPLQWDKKQYALPYYVTAYATYFNKSLFDQAKVPYPKDNFSWDDYLKLAKQLTKGDGPGKIYGSINFDWVMTLMTMVNQKGRDMFTASEQDIVEALKWKNELTNVFKAQPTVAENMATKANPNTLFKQGKGAMLYSVPATFTQTTEAIKTGEAKFTLGMTTIPQLSGTTKPKTIGNITSWGIPNNSKQKDAAWNFIRFETGPEVADLKLKTGFIPANDLGTPDQVYQQFKKLFEADGKVLPEGAKAFFTQEISLELPFDANTPKLRSIYESEAELALTGSKSIEEAAKTIIKKRNEMLKK